MFIMYSIYLCATFDFITLMHSNACNWNSKSLGTLVPTNRWKDEISPLRWPWYEYAIRNHQWSYFELWCCGLHCGLLDLWSRHSIYIRKVISWRLFSVLHSWFMGSFGIATWIEHRTAQTSQEGNKLTTTYTVLHIDISSVMEF